MTKLGEVAGMTTEEKNTELVKGKIIRLDKTSGWGFISSKEIAFTRIFFHWTSLRQDTKNFTELETGMTVEFIPVHSEDRGVRAIKIRVVENSTESATETSGS